MVDTAKQMICRTATTFLYLVLTFAMSSPAVAGQLLGHKGDRLKGSISCIHPNIIRDLSDRIGEEENYTTVARLPTHAQALKDHAKMPGPLPDLERGVALNERDRLY